MRAVRKVTKMTGVKYKGTDRTLVLEDIDEIWLARMCVGEGGIRCSKEHASTLISTLINRYLLHKWRDKWPTNFVAFMRNFSQPINPRWARGGDMSQSSTEAALRRREYICELTEQEIPGEIRALVGQFRGDAEPYYQHSHRSSDDPPSVFVNWAQDTPALRKKYPEGESIGGNWFIVEPSLTEGTVSVVNESEPNDTAEKEVEDLSTVDVPDPPDLSDIPVEKLLKEVWDRFRNEFKCS
jgi:hypothetical protein